MLDRRNSGGVRCNAGGVGLVSGGNYEALRGGISAEPAFIRFIEVYIYMFRLLLCLTACF